MVIDLSKLDTRYKQTQQFILTNKGVPIYKKDAFSFINKILGPQYKWIDKSIEEYFTTDTIQEALLSIKILGFSGKENFIEIKKKYYMLSKEFHPDTGGHSSAFNILNNAYLIFKVAYEKESSDSGVKN